MLASSRGSAESGQHRKLEKVRVGTGGVQLDLPLAAAMSKAREAQLALSPFPQSFGIADVQCIPVHNVHKASDSPTQL